MTLSLYSSGSVAFVGWKSTTETVAVYSSAFRLYRLASYFVTALANGLQGWVAEKQGALRRHRMLLALQAHTAVGVVGMLAMAALLPEVSTLLFGARLSVDHVASLYLGVAFFAASVGNSLRTAHPHPGGGDAGSVLLDGRGRAGRHPAERVARRRVRVGRSDGRPGDQPGGGDRADHPAVSVRVLKSTRV